MINHLSPVISSPGEGKVFGGTAVNGRREHCVSEEEPEFIYFSFLCSILNSDDDDENASRQVYCLFTEAAVVCISQLRHV